MEDIDGEEAGIEVEERADEVPRLGGRRPEAPLARLMATCCNFGTSVAAVGSSSVVKDAGSLALSEGGPASKEFS